jgi:hypothetical protein
MFGHCTDKIAPPFGNHRMPETWGCLVAVVSPEPNICQIGTVEDRFPVYVICSNEGVDTEASRQSHHALESESRTRPSFIRDTREASIRALRRVAPDLQARMYWNS